MTTIDGVTLPAVSEAVRKLGSAIEDAIMTRWNLTNALEEMKMKLETMVGFLEDAERRRSTREAAVGEWLQMLKDFAYNLSDTLDEYYYSNKKRPAPAPGPGTVRLIHYYSIDLVYTACPN